MLKFKPSLLKYKVLKKYYSRYQAQKEHKELISKGKKIKLIKTGKIGDDYIYTIYIKRECEIKR